MKMKTEHTKFYRMQLKAMITGKLTVVNAYCKKGTKILNKLPNLSFQTLEKQEQINFNVSIRKEIKIRVEINELGNREH